MSQTLLANLIFKSSRFNISLFKSLRLKSSLPVKSDKHAAKYAISLDIPDSRSQSNNQKFHVIRPMRMHLCTAFSSARLALHCYTQLRAPAPSLEALAILIVLSEQLHSLPSRRRDLATRTATAANDTNQVQQNNVALWLSLRQARGARGARDTHG